MKNIYPENDDPWSGIISDTDFAVPSTHHTKLQATPGKMFFVHDMIINNPFITEWEDIRRRKNNQLKKFKSKIKTTNKKFIMYVKEIMCMKNSNKYKEP